MVDASNKPDPADGKCQYGVACMFMGGPILENSKKLKHVGLSSQHNEYMAMAFAKVPIDLLDATVVRGDGIDGFDC